MKIKVRRVSREELLYGRLPAPIKVWFSSKQAKEGGTVRRNAKNVLRCCDEQLLRDYVEAKGWQMKFNNGRYIVHCNSDQIYQVS